jgi:hypothetical protein
MGLLWSVDACLTPCDYKELQNHDYFGIFHLLEFITIIRVGNRTRLRHTM